MHLCSLDAARPSMPKMSLVVSMLYMQVLGMFSRRLYVRSLTRLLSVLSFVRGVTLSPSCPASTGASASPSVSRRVCSPGN